MSTETEFKYTIDGALNADRIADSEYVSQYVKDAWQVNEISDVFYDTADWALADMNAMLRVRTTDGVSVGTLKQGSYDMNSFPGLYRGSKYICVFSSAETLIRDLMARGAPDSFEAVAGKPLAPVFRYEYTRRAATLYLPEMTRAEMSFDIGELKAGTKTVKFCEMTLELLFGSVAELGVYCERLVSEYKPEPHRFTKQQLALRMIRSR